MNEYINELCITVTSQLRKSPKNTNAQYGSDDIYWFSFRVSFLSYEILQTQE